MKGLPPDTRYGVPDEAFYDALEEDGGQMFENHEYQWIGEADLEDFLAVYKAEWKALKEQSVSAEKASESLDQDGKYGLKMDWPYDEDLWEELFPFHFADPGVASTAAALCLHGAIPFSSCVGQTGTLEITRGSCFGPLGKR